MLYISLKSFIDRSNQELRFMKKNLLRLAAAATLISPLANGPLPATAAEPIYGVWVRDGHPDDQLEFYDCSGKLCAKGTLPLPDGAPPPEILRNAAKNGANKWKGDLYNPEDGKTYGGEISYDTPIKLTLTGCLMGFLCQSEAWTRVPVTQKPPEPETKVPETPHKAQETQKEPVKELKEKEAVKPSPTSPPAKSEAKSESLKTPASVTTKPAAASGSAPSSPKPATPAAKPSSATVKPGAPATATKPAATSAKPAAASPAGKPAAAPTKPALKPAPAE